MNHEAMRERLALRFYSELDAGELHELDAHLAECAECRALGAELESTLAPLAEAAGSPPELAFQSPALLDLRQSTREKSPWAKAGLLAAGFLIGVLATLALSSEPAPLLTTALGQPPPFFERAEAPPLATTTGQLTTLAALGR